MNYQFTEKCANQSAVAMWQFMQNGLSNDVTIKSSDQKLPYTVKYITNEEVSLSAATRNEGEPETIPFNDFAVVVERLKKHKTIQHLYSQSIFSANRYL